MATKKVSADAPITVADVTVIPVTESVSHCWNGKRVVSFFGVKRPVGVVMVSPSWRKAFRITGEEIPVAQFIQEAPGIKELLDAYH